MSYERGEVTEVTVPEVQAGAALSVVVKYYGSAGSHLLQFTQTTGPDFEFDLIPTGSGSSTNSIIILPAHPLGVNAPAENEEGIEGEVTINYTVAGDPKKKKKSTVVVYEDPDD